MYDINLKYGAETTMTVTLTSLANTTGAQETTVVDNASTKYLDVLVAVDTNGQSSGIGQLDVYVYTSLGTTSYTDGCTGSNAVFTVANKKNLKYLDSIQMNAATAVLGTLLRSIASPFGGVMPVKWGLVFINNSGAALSATGGQHVVKYVGVSATGI